MDEFFGRIFLLKIPVRTRCLLFFRNSTIVKDIFNFMRVSVVLGDIISSDFLRTEGCISPQNSYWIEGEIGFLGKQCSSKSGQKQNHSASQPGLDQQFG